MAAAIALMLRTSPISVTQLSINLANDEFGENNYGKDEVTILSAFFASMDLTRAGYLTSGPKKTFNFLWHAFTQALILQHFDLKEYI